MSFTHSQATASTSTLGSQTSISAVLTNNPASGDVVCVGVAWGDGSTTNLPASISVQDANGNAYTKSTNSPDNNNANTGVVYNFYLANAPANASKTITATFSNPGAGGFAEITADDFAVSGGTASFDADAKGSGTGTTANTPTITQVGAGELFFFYMTTQNGTSSVNAPWTQGAITAFSDATGYLLSSSGNQAIAATITSGLWDAVGMSFKITAAGGVTASQMHAYQRGARRAIEKGRR
jgi:hypothetical protein